MAYLNFGFPFLKSVVYIRLPKRVSTYMRKENLNGKQNIFEYFIKD